MKEDLPVVFRKWKYGIGKGDVTALFPTVPGEKDHYCLSYDHIGQHGDADLGYVIQQTKPASPDEYADLKKEIEGHGGYKDTNLVVYRRLQQWMNEERMANK